MKKYRVLKWEEFFEGAKSKTYSNKTTCQMPTKHGLGYRKLIREKDGPALFGAWCAMIQVISRHSKPRQGYITVDGKRESDPLTAADLSILTDIPEKLFLRMLQICAGQQVRWLEGYHTDTTGPLDLDLDLDLDSNLDSDSCATGALKASAPYSAEFDALWDQLAYKKGKAPAYKAWKKVRGEMNGEISSIVDLYNRAVRSGLDRDLAWSPIHLATWLNQRRWEDEPEQAAPTEPDMTSFNERKAREAAEKEQRRREYEEASKGVNWE